MILEIILGVKVSSTYGRHPIITLWKGYSQCLGNYIATMIREFEVRGFKDGQLVKLLDYVSDPWSPDFERPPWLGNHLLHFSHRSRLKQKDPIYYGHLDGDMTTDYYWLH